MPPKICPQCSTEYELNQLFCPLDGAALRIQVADDNLIGRIFSGRYRLVRKLGGGGMGNVYLAEHVRLKSLAAVKVIRPALNEDPGAVARFNREAQNASLINHPNVASVYDFGEADGLVFLAMEYVDGESLSSLIARGPIPPDRTRKIVFQIAEALGAAHRLGVVHRDLKPDNVMLTKAPDGSDFVKLVDFGISKVSAAEDQKITISGTIIGTPAYMSPEQAKAQSDLDGRSDEYALGVLTFQMLTATLPFEGETSQEQILSRLMYPPATLAKARPEIPWAPAIEVSLAKAMAASRDERFASAQDFARNFDTAVRATAPTVGATVLIDPTQVPGAAGDTPAPAVPSNEPPMVLASPAVSVNPSNTGRRYAVGGGVAVLAAISVVVALRLGQSTGVATHGTKTDSVAHTASLTESTTVQQGGRSTPGSVAHGGNASKPTGGEKPTGAVVQKGPAVVPGQPPVHGTGVVPPGTSKQDSGAARGGRPVDNVPLVDQTQSRKAAAAESTRTSLPSAPPPAPPVDISADIQKIKEVVAAPDRTEAEYRGAYDKSVTLLHTARSTTDSVRIMYYQAQALTMLNDQSGACRVLTRLKDLSNGSPFAATVDRTFQGIGCK